MDIPETITHLRSLDIVNKKRVWKPFMEKYNCQTIAEIGVYKGENFKKLIEHNPKLAVAVDKWSTKGKPGGNDMNFSQKELDRQYSKFVQDMAIYKFVKILKVDSQKAYNYFPDNYFDLIYIDADHTHEGCLMDIKNWYPKVKKDGFLIGDDYREAKLKSGIVFGVVKAVHRFAEENNLPIHTLPRYGWVIIKQ